jgi:hypothetical protein
MAGGIAVLLLIIVLLVAGGIALGLYGTGGFLWWRKTDPDQDRAEHATEDPSNEGARRPQHTRPTTPAQKQTDFVGRERHPHG